MPATAQLIWKPLATAPPASSCSRSTRDACAYPARRDPAHRPRRGAADSQGHAAPEVEHAYTQARVLCQQVGETPELVPVLFGLWRFYNTRAQLHTARELEDTLLRWRNAPTTLRSRSSPTMLLG